MKSENRLRKNEDFNRTYRQGVQVYTKYFKVVARFTNNSYNRYGFSISKKFGKANVRNKLKRRLKFISSFKDKEMNKSFDFVIVPKTEVVNLNFSSLQKEYILALTIVNKKAIEYRDNFFKKRNKK